LQDKNSFVQFPKIETKSQINSQRTLQGFNVGTGVDGMCLTGQPLTERSDGFKPSDNTELREESLEDNSFLVDSQIFQKRLNFISKKLDSEPQILQPVSKDHTRTNKVGMPLDQLHRMESQEKHIFH
jgi:hypothetical protein